MKQTTCGIIVRHNDKILMVHSTGLPWNQWGFPKGISEPGESFIDAAVRETVEETSYHVIKEDLINLGTFDYTDEKNIALFLYVASVEPDVTAMKCPSEFFCDRKQMLRPEVDSFKMVPFTKLAGYFSPRMATLYEKLKGVIEA